MSTSAAAPAREPDDRPRTNRWLKYIGEEDGSFAGNTIPIEHPSTRPLPSFDIVRVERLVGQLEARSMALVKYRYVEPPQPNRHATNKIAIVGALVGLWISTMILTVAYIHSHGLTPPQAANQDRLANKRVISTVPNPKERKLRSRIGQSAKASASSHRLKRLEAAVANADLLDAESPSAESPDAATASITAPTEAPSPDPTVMRQIRPCDTAQPHQAADGTVDYWVMPRGPYDNSPTKVISVGKVANGVVVRNLEDDRYYAVTPAGRWRGIHVRRTEN